jgi:hypothetical protein
MLEYEDPRQINGVTLCLRHRLAAPVLKILIEVVFIHCIRETSCEFLSKEPY